MTHSIFNIMAEKYSLQKKAYALLLKCAFHAYFGVNILITNITPLCSLILRNGMQLCTSNYGL